MAEAAEREEVEAGAAGRPMWSGTLSFGLVSIPVNLLAGVRHRHVAMRLLDADGTPLGRRYACSVEDVEIPAEHIARGYEIEPEKFVVVEDEELEALAPEKSRDIDLRRFVELADVDPAFFDHPYYLTAAGGSTKAYRLLAQTMEETGRAGIATFVMRGKEYLVAILAEGGVLRAETLRFADELRTVVEVGLPEKKKAPARARTQIEKAIRKLAETKVDPADLVDERDRRLLELAAKKERDRRDVVETDVPAEPEDGVVIDLMEKLKRSLRQRGAEPKRRGKTSRRAA
jgi:DNA end-binding protein Ku